MSTTQFDLIEHLNKQIEFSRRTFGPHDRTPGIIKHIEKELCEVTLQPTDLMEWIDIALLAFDGAWRNGFTPEQIAEGLRTKLEINEQRDWPDWRTQPLDAAVEHVEPEPEIHAIGTLLRYGKGLTDLFRVTAVIPQKDRTLAYFGAHCVGGNYVEFHAACTPASSSDREHWEAWAITRDTWNAGSGVPTALAP